MDTLVCAPTSSVSFSSNLMLCLTCALDKTIYKEQLNVCTDACELKRRLAEQNSLFSRILERLKTSKPVNLPSNAQSFKCVTPSKAAGSEDHAQVFDVQGAAISIQRWY